MDHCSSNTKLTSRQIAQSHFTFFGVRCGILHAVSSDSSDASQVTTMEGVGSKAKTGSTKLESALEPTEEVQEQRIEAGDANMTMSLGTIPKTKSRYIKNDAVDEGAAGLF